MSETTTTAPLVTTAAEKTQAATVRGTPESLQSQTFIVSVLLILLVAGTVFGVFLRASLEVISTISSLVIGATLGAICGFYYNASKHAPAFGTPAATTTTVTGNPPSATTTTGAPAP